MNRRSRTCKIEDTVDLQVNREGDIVAQELELRVSAQVLHIAFGAGEQVVEADHFVTPIEQSVDQVGTEEARTAGDEDALAIVVFSHLTIVSLL